MNSNFIPKYARKVESQTFQIIFHPYMKTHLHVNSILLIATHQHQLKCEKFCPFCCCSPPPPPLSRSRLLSLTPSLSMHMRFPFFSVFSVVLAMFFFCRHSKSIQVHKEFDNHFQNGKLHDFKNFKPNGLSS